MNIKKYKKNPLTVLLSILLPLGGLGGLLTSCSDFFDQDSTYIIDAEKDHLNNATDTIYSLTGILNKVQAIADRTILLGEARGDLMTVTDATPADLRAVANFTIGDDNMYNNPLDYYAIINNCNYFIAKADIELKNNRNQFIFKKEYAEVKAIRAWTYLQLVTTYGRVPFVTEPIMTKEESERSYPMYDIKQVCNYFTNDLQELVDKKLDEELPDYGIIKSLPSKNFMFPVRLVLADLYLWAENYYEAAKYYHDFIINRNGKSGIYPTTTYSVRWLDTDWDNANKSWESYTFRSSVEESTASDNELITMIPMDSIPSEGHYSQLRNIFNTTTQNDYKVSLVPSNKIINLSESQVYCYNDQGNVTYPTTTKVKEMTGDLRLSQAWETEKSVSLSTGGTYDYQYIYKYQTKHVHVYRRTLVYLRLAEALNRAGYPRYAFQILSSGVNTEVLQDSIIPHYRADSLKIMEDFNFPGTRLSSISSAYVANSSPYRDGNFEVNTIGIHSRGSGFTPANEYYQMPYNPNITDPAEQLAWQQDKVEEMIIDEEALEFAFEGYRFYDLLRVALRRNDPAWLEKKIQGRNGNAPSGVSVDLKDQNNWFLRWKGRIGF